MKNIKISGKKICLFIILLLTGLLLFFSSYYYHHRLLFPLPVIKQDIIIKDEEPVIVRLYIPDIPQKEKFPVIILCHGASSYKEQLDCFIPELIKRGYITIYFNARNVPQQTRCLYRILEYLPNIPLADSKRVGLIGHSAGASSVLEVACERPEIRAVCIFGMYIYCKAQDGYPHNLLLVFGRYDDYISPEDMLTSINSCSHNLIVKNPGIVYGDFVTGTARKLFISPYSNHFSEVFDPRILKEVISWFDSSIYGRQEKIHIYTPFLLITFFGMLIGLSLIIYSIHFYVLLSLFSFRAHNILFFIYIFFIFSLTFFIKVDFVFTWCLMVILLLIQSTSNIFFINPGNIRKKFLKILSHFFIFTLFFLLISFEYSFKKWFDGIKGLLDCIIFSFILLFFYIPRWVYYIVTSISYTKKFFIPSVGGVFFLLSIIEIFMPAMTIQIFRKVFFSFGKLSKTGKLWPVKVSLIQLLSLIVLFVIAGAAWFILLSQSFISAGELWALIMIFLKYLFFPLVFLFLSTRLLS